MRPAASSLLIASTLFLARTSAHTWNEQFVLIDKETGNYTGPYGYSRGYWGRMQPGWSDYSMTFQIPADGLDRVRIDGTDSLCMPTQRTKNQTAGWPRLKVAPGSIVAMKYLENGHVTQPYVNPGKPEMSGTVFVFGTTSPKPDEKLAQVLLWNRAGTSGDRRGRLLTAQNFDDGRCHQISDAPKSVKRQKMFPDPYPSGGYEQWCETDLVLPDDLKVGETLTVYWVWDWPTAPGTDGVPDGKDQFYTTCSDFDVVAHAPHGKAKVLADPQDPQTKAVRNFKARPALKKVPNLQFDPIKTSKLNGATGVAIVKPHTGTSGTSTHPQTGSSSQGTHVSTSQGSQSVTSQSSQSVTSQPPNPATQTSTSPTSSGSATTSALPPPRTFPGNYSLPASVRSSTFSTSLSSQSSGSSMGQAAPTGNRPQELVFTVSVPVTATMFPSHTSMVVKGSYAVTFVKPGISATGSVVARAAAPHPTSAPGSRIGRRGSRWRAGHARL